jgi:hypothetical protein
MRDPIKLDPRNKAGMKWQFGINQAQSLLIGRKRQSLNSMKLKREQQAGKSSYAEYILLHFTEVIYG